MKTTKQLLFIFWTNLKFIFWESSQSRKLKLFIRDESFYENDFRTRYNYTKKIGSQRSIDEFSHCFLNELEEKQVELNEKKYKKHAQIVENIERYINWLKEQMPLNEKELEKTRLKVLCGPAMFAHLINQLVFNCYVEAPLKKDLEVNYSQTVQILLKSFYIPRKDGKGEVPYDNIANEMGRSTLSEENIKHTTLPKYKG